MGRTKAKRPAVEEIMAMNDDYIDFLKNYDGFDKYILFAIWLTGGEESIDTLAKRLQVTRQTIYNVIKRNKSLYDKYIKPER